jgi:outer membrane protein assembly factor BamB
MSMLVLSGCAGVTELVRDVITGLADIDVSGVTDLFGGGKVELSAEQIAQLAKIPPARPLWRNTLEESQAAVFFPVFENNAVYAASTEGRLVRFNPTSGKEEGSIDTKRRLSGGIGTGEGMLLAGTFKGEVLAYDKENGKALWTAQVSSEVLSPPQAAGGIVVVRAGDGRIFGLEAASGKRKWVYQGATPSLTVRSFAGVLISGATVYAGFAGGKLVTINLSNGAAGWEAVVARPRGATELERIADITSPPVVDEQQVCAVAYQGRVACFEIATGNQIWAKDVSSNAGLAMDNHYVYVSENRGSLLAYDKRDGTSIWKQELLNGIRLSPPLLQGNHVVVGDSQGYVNIIASDNGAMISRTGSDESPILARPVSLPNGFAVQTRKGGILAFAL